MALSSWLGYKDGQKKKYIFNNMQRLDSDLICQRTRYMATGADLFIYLFILGFALRQVKLQ